MLRITGIILLEKTEIIIRIYEVNKSTWKLIRYQNYPIFPKNLINNQQKSAETISAVLANFFSTDNARYVTQWKTGSRGLSPAIVNDISSSLGLEIDRITTLREQELLCKGLFTELW